MAAQLVKIGGKVFNGEEVSNVDTLATVEGEWAVVITLKNGHQITFKENEGDNYKTALEFFEWTAPDANELISMFKSRKEAMEREMAKQKLALPTKEIVRP